jgi:nucleotide-binding universal stress UspA family protein
MRVLMFGRILVAFDGSAPARRATHVATEIAARFHSVLTIANVRPGGSVVRDPVLESLVPLSEEGKAFVSVVEEVRSRALAEGAAAVESVLLQGDVVETLLDWLSHHHQDLVVVGSRGLTRGRRLFLGSVSSGLVNRAPCPVLVVRATREHHVHPDLHPPAGASGPGTPRAM